MSAYLSAVVLVSDTVRTRPPDDQVSPGLIGFLVTFALVIATVFLLRSMVGHLRKVRYAPDQSEPEAPDQNAEDASGVSGVGGVDGVDGAGTKP